MIAAKSGIFCASFSCWCAGDGWMQKPNKQTHPNLEHPRPQRYENPPRFAGNSRIILSYIGYSDIHSLIRRDCSKWPRSLRAPSLLTAKAICSVAWPASFPSKSSLARRLPSSAARRSTSPAASSATRFDIVHIVHFGIWANE